MIDTPCYSALSYGRIDTIDQMIKHCNMGYRLHKYWHNAMTHGIALAIVVAYDMYLECASGKLCLDWEVKKPKDFQVFRDRLSQQALHYKPRHQLYPGDKKCELLQLLLC